MKYCHYYWFIEPLRTKYVDSPERMPTCSLDLRFPGVTLDLGIFCDPHGAPEFARAVLNGLSEEEIPQHVNPHLHVIREHMLSVLRLVYRDDVQLFPMAAWSFWDIGTPHHFGIQLDMEISSSFNPSAFRNLFIHSSGMRTDFRLLVDGIDERIPMQYRYLSFYKILERKFKNGQTWNSETLDKHLSGYAERFKSAGINSKPSAELHAVRDRCAHIRTGSRKIVLGVTQLNHKELVRTERLMPILRDICRDLVNELADGKFVLGPLAAWYE